MSSKGCKFNEYSCVTQCMDVISLNTTLSQIVNDISFTLGAIYTSYMWLKELLEKMTLNQYLDLFTFVKKNDQLFAPFIFGTVLPRHRRDAFSVHFGKDCRTY